MGDRSPLRDLASWERESVGEEGASERPSPSTSPGADGAVPSESGRLRAGRFNILDPGIRPLDLPLRTIVLPEIAFLQHHDLT